MPRLLFLLMIALISMPAMSAKVLILGDSLSAGYNMPVEKSWPTLLNIYWQTSQTDHQAINASISGETTDGGARRLPALLTLHQPDYVLIELGANDGLRGFAPPVTEQQLTAMITHSQQAGVKVILMQIKLPRNYGKRYTDMFEGIYPKLSKQFNIPLLPFLLEEIIVQPDLMMADGMHPKATSQPIIAQAIQAQLKEILK